MPRLAQLILSDQCAAYLHAKVRTNLFSTSKTDTSLSLTKLIWEHVESAKKFLPIIVVQIRDRKNTVAFKTPMVAKRTPLLSVRRFLSYQHSHQRNHLARSFTVGISVVESLAQIEYSLMSVRAVVVPLKD